MQGVILDFDTLGPSDLDLKQIYELPIDWKIHNLCRPSDVSKLIADADIVLINKSPIREPALQKATRLKFISIFATGTDIIDLDAAKRRNIIVSNAVGYGTTSVVQHVWALILTLTTQLDNYREAATNGRWEDSESFCVMDYKKKWMTNKKRILSGVQPTGDLHIGNWLGAINNWVELQEKHETFLCVVDLHAITTEYDPKQLSKNTLSTAALYIACGINPKICSIFVQSQISAHSELCWILNCMTPINWMERMIQFKEKSIQQGNNVSIGLFDYPILMAADILLYDADYVPVGEDQKQHLELARDIAQQRINAKFSKEENILKIPQPIIMKKGSKIMSLNDGSKKMSKSDINEGSRINLLDTPEIITKKIKRAKSDSYMGMEFNNPERPESRNLLMIYSLLSGKEVSELERDLSQTGWGTFKKIFTEQIIESLKPIQERYQVLINDPYELNKILIQGKEQAEAVANKTLSRVKSELGFFEIEK